MAKDYKYKEGRDEVIVSLEDKDFLLIKAIDNLTAAINTLRREI